MKKLVFLLCLAIMSCTMSSQEHGKQINYLTGSSIIPGYAVVTKTMDIASYTFTSESVRAPILQVYVCDKSKFIGGTLLNEKGEETKILNLKIHDSSGEFKFEVVGEKFSRFLNLSDGEMLLEDKTHTVFYMPSFGVWTIYRKGVKVKK